MVSLKPFSKELNFLSLPLRFARQKIHHLAWEKQKVWESVVVCIYIYYENQRSAENRWGDMRFVIE